jgi:hypothetical protein
MNAGMKYLRVWMEGEWIRLLQIATVHLKIEKGHIERTTNKESKEVCKICTLITDLRSICLVEDVFVSV